MTTIVLFGGLSDERHVSVATAQSIARALGNPLCWFQSPDGAVYDVAVEQLLAHQRPFEIDFDPMRPAMWPDLDQALDTLPVEDPVVVLALHGGAGEDGTVQALLELMGVRYTGSGPLGSGIAMDKDVSKRLFRDAQVPTLPWRVARAPSFSYDPDTIEDLIGIPCIVKPSRQGSSVGIHVVSDAGELRAAVDDAAKYDAEVMIERYAKGRELTVGILGDQALPPVEIRPKKGIYDYHSKYTPGMTEYFCPAPVEEEVVAQLQAYALRAFRVLKLRGYGRIDFILAKEQLFCLEANTLPGMTATSLLPKGAAAVGIDFPELCDRIARIAAGR